MKKRDILKFIIKPPKWCRIAVWTIELLSLSASMTLYYVGLGLKLWALPVHIVALVFLLLSVYVVLTIFGVPERAKDKPKVRKFFSNYSTRAFVYATCSVVFNLCYVIFGILLAVLEHSPWLGVLVGYHIFLIVPRVEVLYTTKIRGRNDTADGADDMRKLRAYTYCGLALVLLAEAFVPVIRMTINDMNSYNYFVETTVYVSGVAAYTFTKLGIALYNMKKAYRSSDMSLIAVKNISFADALISVFALQAMMIKELNNGAIEFATSINASVGGLIAIGIFALGVYMMVSGNKKLKAIKAVENETETADGEE